MAPNVSAAWGNDLRSAKDPPTSSEQVSAGTGDKSARSSGKASDRDMGSALRSIYQRTIEESIPDEMLSLLGKLD